MKALRRACVGHSMGKAYNEFVGVMKEKYRKGDKSDMWEMVSTIGHNPGKNGFLFLRFGPLRNARKRFRRKIGRFSVGSLLAHATIEIRAVFCRKRFLDETVFRKSSEFRVFNFCTGWFTLKTPKFYSPANVHAVFPIQTVFFFSTRLLCALARTSPDFFFFLPDFLPVKIFRKMWTTLAQPFSAKNKKKRRKKRGSGLGISMQNTCAKKIRAYPNNGVDIFTFVRKNE